VQYIDEVWLALLVLLVLIWPLARAIFRSNELAVLEFEGGRLTLARGRLPHDLFNDLEDVLKRGRITRASLRVVVESRSPRLIAQGVDAEAVQRLRNVVGRFPLATIRSGRRRAAS
jgi:hypothetical protein